MAKTSNFLSCPQCCGELSLRTASLGNVVARFLKKPGACRVCGYTVPRGVRSLLCPKCCQVEVCQDCALADTAAVAAIVKPSGSVLGCGLKSGAQGMSKGSRGSTGKSSSIPQHIVRRACRYGLACYQCSPEHNASYAHPGDADYKLGGVAFDPDQSPQLPTLWHLFLYFDTKDSGYLSRETFAPAALFVGRLAGTLPHRSLSCVEPSWEMCGGAAQGFVGFVRFASWTYRFGLRLPLGLDTEAADPIVVTARLGCCRLDSCDCPGFRPFEKALPAQLSAQKSSCAQCGHRVAAHRSNAAEQPINVAMLGARPPHWRREAELGSRSTCANGLVEVRGAAFEMLQFLLDVTHKETDNWTRDRGCAIHGVQKCLPECLYSNHAIVPAGYRLIRAHRNQNPGLWARYSLMRAAVQEQCLARGGCARVVVESSMPPFDQLDSAPCDGSVNEWRLFHGTNLEACRDICEGNFNVSLAGAGATWKDGSSTRGTPLYGFGVYFSERITKADEYARVADTGSGPSFFVLLCRAVAGKVCICTGNEIDANALRGQVFDGPHHSVLGDRVAVLKKPFREMVIYDRDQIYPEFLLKYARIF